MFTDSTLDPSSVESVNIFYDKFLKAIFAAIGVSFLSENLEFLSL